MGWKPSNWGCFQQIKEKKKVRKTKECLQSVFLDFASRNISRLTHTGFGHFGCILTSEASLRGFLISLSCWPPPYIFAFKFTIHLLQMRYSLAHFPGKQIQLCLTSLHLYQHHGSSLLTVWSSESTVCKNILDKRTPPAKDNANLNNVRFRLSQP